MKVSHVLALPPALLAFVFLVSLTGIFPWSSINCWRDEIDIRSGRIRETRYLFFCRVSERVASTPLSEALLPADLQSTTPEWKRVNTRSPGVHHSPHYAFHGAIAQTEMIANAWSTTPFTSAARRESALQLLSAWQHGHSYRAANPYLQALRELATTRSNKGSPQPIEAGELPPNEPATVLPKAVGDAL